MKWKHQGSEHLARWQRARRKNCSMTGVLWNIGEEKVRGHDGYSKRSNG